MNWPNHFSEHPGFIIEATPADSFEVQQEGARVKVHVNWFATDQQHANGMKNRCMTVRMQPGDARSLALALLNMANVVEGRRRGH